MTSKATVRPASSKPAAPEPKSKAPVATEPGCQHPDCVLEHPHDGPAILAKPEKPMTENVHRAGGWIDRGDGRGWELEE